MKNKLLVFDSHPVPYRTAIWQTIEAISPGAADIVYASDCSVKGYDDTGFSKLIAWDPDIMKGYTYTVLNNENGIPLSGPRSLTGKGVREIIEQVQPQAILLTGLNYKFDSVALKEAYRLKIPVWLRCETQDQAMNRSYPKSFIRFLFYRFYYKKISLFFYIGELNRRHYLRHGVSKERLIPALYGTIETLKGIEVNGKEVIRRQARADADISPEAIVIGFTGKLISKKNPGILFEMLKWLPVEIRSKVVLYFVGSGYLSEMLRQSAETALELFGIRTVFTGFQNQSELTKHYLAMDIFVLPSRRKGETWGLVSNEALQTGCTVIVSNAVGCHADFGDWERVRVFKDGDARELAESVVELTNYSRSFDWASRLLQPYSVEAVAKSILKQMKVQ